jgi:hypothetical protein
VDGDRISNRSLPEVELVQMICALLTATPAILVREKTPPVGGFVTAMPIDWSSMGTREAPLSPVNERLVEPLKLTDATAIAGFDAGEVETGGLVAGGVLPDVPESPPPHAASSVNAVHAKTAILRTASSPAALEAEILGGLVTPADS